MSRNEDHHQAEWSVALWCGETCAFRIHQRLRHILHQLADFRGCRIFDELRRFLQDWVPHSCDFEYCHRLIIWVSGRPEASVKSRAAAFTRQNACVISRDP